MCKSLGYGQSKERQLNKVQVAVVVILLTIGRVLEKIFSSFFLFAISPTEKMLKKTLDLATLSTRN